MAIFNELQEENQTERRFIIKRSGIQVPYEPIKIRKAIEAANFEEKRELRKLTADEINNIVDAITADVYRSDRAFSVEEIQEKVLECIFETGKKSIYDLYRDYRNKHTNRRKMNGLDAKIASIIELEKDSHGTVGVLNEEVKQENSNKNPTIISVQRDYMAGEWSRHYVAEYLFPEDLIRAHEEGIIHIHDTDYISCRLHNCDLVNLEDMLQNGTAISGTHIDPPKSFATACTVASQIVASVASSQFGGQTISLAHLAPFVDVSRQKIRKRLAAEFAEDGIDIPEEKINSIAEKELLKEVESGMQTVQYQLVTLMSTNGQAPFVTVWMYLHEVPEGRLRDDLALCIKVMLEQRILGIKDRSGNYITPAFPKLIYCLQEDNIKPGSRYYDLTVLAAKCTAKRMVPDYVSEKVMLALKGDVYPPMGLGNLAHSKSFEPYYSGVCA